MCIIAVCNTRRLSLSELFSCWNNNSDGAGIGWVENGKHTYVKGLMTYQALLQEYNKITAFPHVVHFRMGTAGDNSPELTHPFICKRKSPLKLEWNGTAPLIFHNGVVFGWHQIAKHIGVKVPNPKWSDTRVLASVWTRKDMDFLLEDGGKFVVFLDKEIKLIGKFIEDNGIYFSNGGYNYVWSYYDYLQPTSYINTTTNTLPDCDGHCEKCNKYNPIDFTCEEMKDLTPKRQTSNIPCLTCQKNNCEGCTEYFVEDNPTNVVSHNKFRHDVPGSRCLSCPETSEVICSYCVHNKHNTWN